MDQEELAVEALRKRIAKRLRSICSHIPTSELDSYVERLAFVERGYQVADDLEAFTLKRQTPGKGS